MSKIIKPLLIVAAIAVNVIPGVGQAISASVFGALAGTVGLAAAATIASLAPLALTVAGLGALSSILSPKTPQSPLGQLDRLNASVNPNAPRAMVLGDTAMATDIRYVEPSGTDQEYIDYIIGVACHKVTSIDQIWLEQRLAWTAGGGVDSFYSGYLWIDTVLEGNASNTIAINGGGTWGTNARLTGCAYVHLRLKRTGNSSKATSPLASGLPSRVTIIGKGMPIYDPRRDSTVSGGSGSMRADDQSTWSFAPGGTEIGNNLALQILNYHLGWRINGKVSVGPGLPKERLNMPSFIVAANLCDEAVTKADSSTEPRYHGSAVATEGNQPQQVMSVLLAACNGRLRDNGGQLSLAIMHNDLAAASADPGLNDDDVLGGFTWEPYPAVAENIVRGKYTDPSDNSLYQPIDYPEVKLTSLDGIDRVLPLDLLAVESPSQAERIAKQVLERRQYQGQFSANFSNRAWKYQIGDVVPLTFSACGFVEKLFRVADQTIAYDGTCPMVLVEENDAIYAWDASETAPVTAAAAITFDPRNSPYVLGIEDAATTAEWTGVSSRPLQYRVVAKGHSASYSAHSDGVYDETDTGLSTGGRSYIVVEFSRSTSLRTSSLIYDVFASSANAASMAAHLNGLGNDKIVVIWTADEPQSNRLSSGLDAAMYRCGASPAVFGSSNLFKYRSAYILIGIPGSGQGNGYEAYAGDVDDSAGAWLDVAFQIYNGAPLISGTQRTNSSVRDLDYTGDLNADVTAPTLADLLAATAAYSSGTTYQKGGFAKDQGALWIYINATPGSGHAPPTLPTIANSYWQFFALISAARTPSTIGIVSQAGSTGSVQVALGNGEGLSVAGQIRVAVSGSCTQHLTLEYRLLGAGSWTTIDTQSDSDNTFVAVFAGGGFTNTTGASAVYEVRATTTKTGASGTIDAPTSFFTA